MNEIEYLRNEERIYIEWVIFCQNHSYKECEQMFINFLAAIRAKIKEFYETTILD